jgi:MFS family permease
MRAPPVGGAGREASDSGLTRVLLANPAPYKVRAGQRGRKTPIPGIPAHASAILNALQLTSPDWSACEQFGAREWEQALRFCERTELTLALAIEGREHLPADVRRRMEGHLENNAARWERAQATYRELGSALAGEGLEHTVLKGFSHCPLFVRDPRHRPQGDLDLLFPPEQVPQARDVAAQLGYEPIVPADPHPIDHLPTMIRKTGWTWRGDPYDPEMPLSLELHFRLWDSHTERLAPQGLDRFWERRQNRELEGLQFAALHPADAIGYSALHSLRHLLRGDIRLFHIYELARALHESANHGDFWDSWLQLQDASLRRLEAICFALAEGWFACRVPDVAREEIASLPDDVKRWVAEYQWSPVENLFRPNKRELWLHWSLVDAPRGRAAVLRRRLLPERLPGPFGATHVPESQITWPMRLRSRVSYIGYLASRLVHHARAIVPTAWSAVQWFAPRSGLGSEYWRLLASEGFFDFGMFVFFFLYNLYLVKLGFREDFLGWMSGLTTAANIVGSILAVLAIQRFGMRRVLMSGFALTAVLSALRACVLSRPALLALAAAAGLAFSVWPVALAPMVAGVTTEKGRARGFSLICSAGISIGIFGSLAAARLPAWITRLRWASSEIASYRIALLIGCGIVLLSLWPLSRVKMLAAAEVSQRKPHRPSPVVVRFLIAMLVWNIGTGVFNPFSSVFFARMHMAVERIGIVFSFSQLAQVAAILCAPFFFRRFGTVGAIVRMELATALGMLAMAASGGPLWAAAAYTGYMSFQYMSEPGMFTLLMDSVKPGERNNASALNFLVSFGGQAIAASSAGWLLARFGYPPVLVAGATISAGAAFLLRALLSKPSSPSPAGS